MYGSVLMSLAQIVMHIDAITDATTTFGTPPPLARY